MTATNARVWSLVSAFLRLMFQIYVDESVSESPPVYVMAGFISTAEKWAAFSDEWRQRVEMKPRIAYFKMSEAMSFQGEFSGFSPESRDEKIVLMDSLIQEYAMGSISLVLDHREYRRVFGDPLMPKPLRSPYYFLAYEMMKELPAFQSYFDIGGGIDFIFDEQVGEMDKIIAAWNDFKSLSGVPWKKQSSVPKFRDEKKVLPIQAADMLAWIVRKRTEDGILKLPPTQPPLFKVDRKDVPMLMFVYDKSYISSFFERVVHGPRLKFSFGNWQYVKPLSQPERELPPTTFTWSR
jgi:Protein of unknown function (DUF3800)